MPERIKKDHMLNFLPEKFEVEKNIHPERIFEPLESSPKSQKTVYLMTRELRLEDNFAFNYAIEQGNDLEVLLLIPQFDIQSKQKFFEKQLSYLEKNLKKHKIKYTIFRNPKDLNDFLKKEKIEYLIKDFDPIEEFKLPENIEITEIDGHNICPARQISDKQEYNAASLRRKIYYRIAEFLTEYPPFEHTQTEAWTELTKFIGEKLDTYAKDRNDPTKNATSNLSKYMNWGFISSQRIALEVLNSSVSSENKEAFLEELIVRKELSDNFCLYNKKYKTFDGIPAWAKETLKTHSKDLRTNIFTLEELEDAKSYDDLWNASQKQMIKDGKMHGYMRMYWAKKILDWTNSPDEALKYAIYLNDKYGFDSPSSNGYVGILWSIGGLHDRAFAERLVSGKIRPMTYNGAKSKFDIKKYIEMYSD